MLVRRLFASHFRCIFGGFSAKKLVILPSKVSSRFKSESESKSVSEAVSVIKNGLAKQPKSRVFIGTGQYYTHHTNERVLVLSLGDASRLHGPPIQLLDTGIPATELLKLEKEVSIMPNCSELVTGEVDSIYNEPWMYGFTTNLFSIFSKSGYCLTTELKPTSAFRIFNGPLFEDIPMGDIKNIQIRVSEEPWEERILEVKMKSDEIMTVIEDKRNGGSVDLGQLMVSTEWMLKAAGNMCLVARLTGNGQDVVLKLPDSLRAENNPWIDLRNKEWIDRVHDQNQA